MLYSGLPVSLAVKPNLLRAITLLGHACLRMGLHAEASQFLHDGLALAMASGGALATGLQLKPLRYGSGGGGGCVSVSVGAVSYTHLTLPTI